MHVPESFKRAAGNGTIWAVAVWSFFSPLVFIATIIWLDLTADASDPFIHSISSLAHSRFGFWLDVSFVVHGVVILAFAVGPVRWAFKTLEPQETVRWPWRSQEVRKLVLKWVAVGALAVGAVCIALLGVFATDPPETEAARERTGSGPIHNTLAFAGFAGLAMGAWFTARFFHDVGHAWPGGGLWSVVLAAGMWYSLALTGVILLVDATTNQPLGDYFGFGERALSLFGLLWMAWVSTRFLLVARGDHLFDCY